MTEDIKKAFQKDERGYNRYKAITLLLNNPDIGYYDNQIKEFGISKSSLKIYEKKYRETKDISCFLTKRRNTGKVENTLAQELYLKIKNRIPKVFQEQFKRDNLAIQRYAGFLFVQQGFTLMKAAEKVKLPFSVISKYRKEYLIKNDVSCFLTEKTGIKKNTLADYEKDFFYKKIILLKKKHPDWGGDKIYSHYVKCNKTYTATGKISKRTVYRILKLMSEK